MGSSSTVCLSALELVRMIQCHCQFESKVTDNRTASNIYPPRSNRDLRSLFQKITSSQPLENLKHSLVYYILKDLDLKQRSADEFAQSLYLPPEYRAFIDGIWCLDRLRIEVRDTSSTCRTFLSLDRYSRMAHRRLWFH